MFLRQNHKCKGTEAAVSGCIKEVWWPLPEVDGRVGEDLRGHGLDSEFILSVVWSHWC